MSHYVALYAGAIALGFAVAAPIGPTGVTAIRYGLSRGATTAFWIGMGAAATDLAYVMAVYLGLAPLLNRVPWLPFVSYVAGTYMLGTMGLAAMKTAVASRRRRDMGKPTGRVDSLGDGWWRAFLLGLSITVVNPATISSWLSLGGAFVAANLVSLPVPAALAILTGIIVGSAGWFSILACLVGLARVASGRAPIILDLVGMASALILLGFAALFLVQAVRFVV
jgi:threonine/homoserine/homoserine lactone efflux protein